MDLADSLAFLSLLVHWRVVLCMVVGGALGWLLAVTLELISGLQGIALPLFGLFGGIGWDLTAREGPSELKTTFTVAALSASVCGCIWGAMSFQAPVAGAAVLILALVTWFCYSAVIHRWFTGREGFAIGGVSLVSYCVVAFMLSNATK